MKQRLIWKLLLINILPVIAVIILVIWLAIDQLAADYFMVLMEKYAVMPTDTHEMFLQAVHRYLIWATLAALALALLLSFLLTRRVLRPLTQMTEITQDVARGRFTGRVDARSSDEVGQLGRAFNRMADSLEKVEQLRKNMVADVAHELRTPLTNLRGYLEGLNDHVIPPTPETYAMLRQEVMRLVQLVEDLQQLARAEAAGAYLNRRPIDLHRLVSQMLALERNRIEEKDISVFTDFMAEAAEVNADADKVLQAIRNLVDNALKYAPPGGWLRIATGGTESGVRLIFANNGPDIPADDLPYIFERFFRADRSRSRAAGGGGIGLAIVKELIEAHGGRVGAESGDGATRVWIEIPT